MNIFVIHNNYPSAYNKTDADAFIIEKPVIYTLTDTALTKDGKPFFIPDFASPCTFQMSLVLRISRLGRSISPRFAHRYYDALTVGVMFTVRTCLNTVSATLFHGKWQKDLTGQPHWDDLSP